MINFIAKLSPKKEIQRSISFAEHPIIHSINEEEDTYCK